MKSKMSSLAVRLASLGGAGFLGGCSDAVLFNSKGPVGEAEMWALIIAFGLMTLILVPVLLMTIVIPLYYRATNKKAEYLPKWDFSLKIELVTWLFPVFIVICLAMLTFYKTFKLDPFKPLAAAEEHLNIQVVSLDWKWLFIYPEQGVASVNKLVIPEGVPLRFDITSDTVMTSFFIPQLGSQIYAMPRHRSVLHLMATETGEMRGQNNNLSGEGYSHMHFPVSSVTQAAFDDWIAEVRGANEALTVERFEALSEPTMGYPQTVFSSVDDGLFEHVLTQFDGPGGGHGRHGHGGEYEFEAHDKQNPLGDEKDDPHAHH
ncbi:MAG: ubiquinol oxidase subunit II [Alphaproteobacteria bacterium]|nr:ubiquinol oxidase subunit II [Alphaproteobacteria bacterium]